MSPTSYRTAPPRDMRHAPTIKALSASFASTEHLNVTRERASVKRQPFKSLPSASRLAVRQRHQVHHRQPMQLRQHVSGQPAGGGVTLHIQLEVIRNQRADGEPFD